MKYHSDQHLRDQLNRLRKDDILCDVTISVGGRKIHAHKNVLAASCPYFEKMFTGGLSESNQSEVTIREVDEEAMETLIEFCYTSSIEVEKSNVQDLLAAACFLQIVEVKDACSKFLKSHIDPGNCLGIRAIAELHDCRDLLGISDEFSKNNFQEVMKQEEFLQLPLAQLIDIISSDVLDVSSEEQVYVAVMSWIKHNKDERRSHLKNILKHVRLHLLTPEFLYTVSDNYLIMSDDACGELVIQANKYLLLTHGERPQMPGRRLRMKECLMTVGGGSSVVEIIASVDRYDPETGEWKMMSPMSQSRNGNGVAVLNNLLYAVGGFDGRNILNSVEKYDPVTNLWSSVAPMSRSRSCVGVAALDGFLYVTGGEDSHRQVINIVDKYDPNKNTWTRVAPMNTVRYGHAAVTFNGSLYVIGGTSSVRKGILNSVERYDPRENKWTMVAPMSTKREWLGAAVFNNKICVAGGSNDNNEDLSSCEVYDPNTDTWSRIGNMKFKRYRGSLAVIKGQLFALGGSDTTSVKTIEVYDKETDTWKLSGSMKNPRTGMGVGVVRMLA